MRKEKTLRLWPALLALSLVAGASTLSPALPRAHAGLFSISEKEEVQAGQQVKQQAYKEYGQPLPANHAMSRRVRALGQKFANLSQRRNIPYTYEVLQNDKLLNAFAAPGGPIFVTSKLVSTAANDAELAYVIGHETAHIDRKHIVKAVEKQQKVGLGVGILGAILGGGSGGDLFQVFGNVAFTVWTRGYSRDQERESDIVGTRWMSQLGYDPNAAISMLGRLGGGGGGGLDKYLASHPNPKDRQENLRQLIASENLLDVARRSGGPRLSSTGSPEYSTANTSAPNSFAGNYIPVGNGAPSVSDTPRVDFSGRLLMVQRGNQSTIMAPVSEVARWANANVTVDPRNNDIVTVQRGANSIRLRRNSAKAVVNGRTTTLSAAAAVYNDLLYAPLGTLADGVGATASLSGDNRTIWLSLNGRHFHAPVPSR